MGDSMVIKTDEMKAEMVNYIKRNMTITLSLTTLILDQVDRVQVFWSSINVNARFSVTEGQESVYHPTLVMRGNGQLEAILKLIDFILT